MGKQEKRKRSGDDSDGEDGPSTSGKEATVGMRTSHIKNKLVRSEMYAKLRSKDKKKKKAERTKRQKEDEKAMKSGLEPPPRKQQKTIENMRVKDETMVTADDEEVAADEEQDEFSEHFARVRPPKVLLTTCYKPSKIMYTFLSEMLEVLPHAEYYKRGGFPLKKIVQFASNRDFTDLVVFNEDSKEINGMLLVHLPDGPTARFRLSSLVLGKDIKGHGRATEHKPELVLNNFGTRIGRRVGRMFASLFAQDPAFRGRRVVTFHNQRDFIFFRHHRYIFEEKEKRITGAAAVKKPGEKTPAPSKQNVVQARLQELGPQFTLKLESIQKGTFDSTGGEFEWLKTRKMEAKRKFFL
ncbi:anticodon-binding protein [Dunaliella salina]|uniref:Anticodon-binding protein n=1 Tax=Dunaliella salina TaxID=3046 RepID=A0ABQ7GPR3_DUNSA|nr:anticodon-binding protein [Dunaliella salina]|eukprot:KAF5836597.1 anticodon-binding protein [Dunaliella salina]